MRNYLCAECNKAFHRFYFHMALLVSLGGVGLLLFSCWLTYHWGNGNISFYSTASMVAAIMVIGLYATILTGDIVFSEQYKNNTLKNEVAYGLPRVRIYLGKLLVSTLVSVVACAVLLGVYVAGCWLLFPHGELDGMVFQVLGYCLAGALPLWLGGQGLMMACYFLIGNSTAAAFTAVGFLGVLPTIFEVLGMLVSPVFTVIYQFMPATMLNQMYKMPFDWNYTGLCWLVGMVWLVGSTIVGLLLFRKKEIR